jgi:hypothetical protein
MNDSAKTKTVSLAITAKVSACGKFCSIKCPNLWGAFKCHAFPDVSLTITFEKEENERAYIHRPEKCIGSEGAYSERLGLPMSEVARTSWMTSDRAHAFIQLGAYIKHDRLGWSEVIRKESVIDKDIFSIQNRHGLGVLINADNIGDMKLIPKQAVDEMLESQGLHRGSSRSEMMHFFEYLDEEIR